MPTPQDLLPNTDNQELIDILLAKLSVEDRCRVALKATPSKKTALWALDHPESNLAASIARATTSKVVITAYKDSKEVRLRQHLAYNPNLPFDVKQELFSEFLASKSNEALAILNAATLDEIYTLVKPLSAAQRRPLKEALNARRVDRAIASSTKAEHYEYFLQIETYPEAMSKVLRGEAPLGLRDLLATVKNIPATISKLPTATELLDDDAEWIIDYVHRPTAIAKKVRQRAVALTYPRSAVSKALTTENYALAASICQRKDVDLLVADAIARFDDAAGAAQNIEDLDIHALLYRVANSLSYDGVPKKTKTTILDLVSKLLRRIDDAATSAPAAPAIADVYELVFARQILWLEAIDHTQRTNYMRYLIANKKLSRTNLYTDLPSAWGDPDQKRLAMAKDHILSILEIPYEELTTESGFFVPLDAMMHHDDHVRFANKRNKFEKEGVVYTFGELVAPHREHFINAFCAADTTNIKVLNAYASSATSVLDGIEADATAKKEIGAVVTRLATVLPAYLDAELNTAPAQSSTYRYYHSSIWPLAFHVASNYGPLLPAEVLAAIVARATPELGRARDNLLRRYLTDPTMTKKPKGKEQLVAVYEAFLTAGHAEEFQNTALAALVALTHEEDATAVCEILLATAPVNQVLSSRNGTKFILDYLTRSLGSTTATELAVSFLLEEFTGPVADLVEVANMLSGEV